MLLQLWKADGGGGGAGTGKGKAQGPIVMVAEGGTRGRGIVQQS